jgi:glutamyl-tRNA reductase
MSGSAVAEALRTRFETIRQTELQRLAKKLRTLTPEERSGVEAITADVVRAIAGLPARALAEHAPARDVDALTRLFDLS